MSGGLRGTFQPTIESPMLRSMTEAEFACEERRFKDARNALQRLDQSALAVRCYWTAVVL